MPIEVLDQATICRIAAGEVIIRPVSAIKELIENSLDAKASMIQVEVQEGGLKLIKVKDDGTGINVNDLPMLCHRYATSKLVHFHDMTHLTTFGFRGEALASISDMADVTVYTKTEDTSFGFKAIFKQGIIVNRPAVCATVKGTSILIENLFKNTPIRLKSMRPSQEYAKILECMEKYAIHYFETSFMLKKDVVQFQVKKAPDRVERIQSVYPCQACQSIQYKEHHQFEFEMVFSIEQDNNNRFILFVNDRLVENKTMKRKIYDTFLCQKDHRKPSLVYLALNVFDRTQIDVNVHPTKNEVALLNQDTFIDIICHLLVDKLTSSVHTPHSSTDKPISFVQTPLTFNKQKALPKVKTLDGYFNIKPSSKKKKNVAVVPQLQKKRKTSKASPKKDMSHIIRQLQQQVLEVKDEGISMLFEKQKYIGYINPLLVLSKYQDTYYLFNINMTSQVLFYQLLLDQFGNYGRLILNPPLSLKQCSELMHVQDMTPLFVKHQAILDYFAISINSDGLVSLPMLIPNYVPTATKLPVFVYRLVTTVDYSNDIQCFQDICREVGQLYSCTDASQYEKMRTLLPCLKVPRYLVQEGHLVGIDVPSVSL